MKWVAALAFSCATVPYVSPRQHSRIDDLHLAYTERLDELREASDPVTGWPSSYDCDGLLWAGLACAAHANWVRIDLAEDNGHMERSPIRKCYPKGSKSSISRDMLTGYLHCLVSRSDRSAIERLANYGERNDWVMGEGEPARTFMMPNLMRIVGCAIGLEYCDLPPFYPPVSADYEKHIQVLGILLQGQINEQMLDRLAENVKNNPKDALFNAALGRYTGEVGPAISLLLDPAYEPPSYVRGHPNYALVHWIFATHVVLTTYGVTI